MPSLRIFAVSVFLLVATACGSGTAGPPAPGDPPVPVQLALLKAILLGSLETTVVDADAQAAILVDLRDDGQLEFGCAVEADWVADVTGMHIHRGAAGVDGAIEVDLLGGGASFDAGTLTAGDTLSIDPALAAEIAASPGDFYVNIHTTGAGGGLVRQQLEGGGALEVWTTLLGTSEVPVVDDTARGAFTMSVNADHSVDYAIAMRNPPVNLVTLAHIHTGVQGANGGIFVDLDTPSATVNVGEGLITGTVTPTLAQIARVCNGLAEFYVNVHTALYPAGVARGQLGQVPVQFWAPLEAGNEVTPPSNPNARGGVSLQFDSLTGGWAHLAVPPAEDITLITGAHVHQGLPPVDGPIRIDLQAGGDYVVSPQSFSAEGSITCTPTLLAQMAADPSQFYVNFHTAADMAGAVRGQLSQDPVTFVTALDGANEIPPVVPAGIGTFSMVATEIFECSFTVNMTTPAASTVISGHVHDGDATVPSGPVLIDLIGGLDVMVSGNFITGRAPFSGRTLARLLAVPENFYANMHTVIAQGGVARGQLARQTEDTAPIISYTTPVTYTEGTPISNNVPTNIGGAISSFSVSPALPSGLSLDPNSGVISGTPVGGAAAADYDVTATNASGMGMATVNITVNPIAPTNLSYQSPVTYTTGTQITPNSPTNTGGLITSYSVSPALPAGLSLNTTTGVITGTPTSATSQATYTVTGSNGAGNTMFGISITVNQSLQPPSGLSYTTPVTYTTGTAITPNNPTIGGGAVSSWSVSPSLPTGLSLSTSTGVISGTPTQVTSAANYTVTATNAAGFTNAMVNITVNLGAPTNLAYSPSNTIGYVNTAIQDMNPTSQGGAVSSYSISPALPSGLSMSTSTGVITGTPTATSAQQTYTITATNTAGNTQATVQIIVY